MEFHAGLATIFGQLGGVGEGEQEEGEEEAEVKGAQEYPLSFTWVIITVWLLAGMDIWGSISRPGEITQYNFIWIIIQLLHYSVPTPPATWRHFYIARMECECFCGINSASKES